MRSNHDFEAMFPCRQLPADIHDCKLLGLGKQISGDRWFQRVKIRGGIVTGDQWRTLAALAREHTPGGALHLTTRQDIEFHNLTDDAIPPLQTAIAQAGLTTLAGSGDSVRNIVICPCNSALGGSIDLLPVAKQIEAALRSEEGLFALPRKFKISLSCSDDCGKPYAHDVAFVAHHQEGQWGFRVILAGSLGALPGTGIKLTDWLPASRATPLVVTLVRLFAAHGDRDNRRKARLRHIRERMGDEAFIELVSTMLAETLTEDSWPRVQLLPNASPRTQSMRLRFALGDITPDAADALARLADNDRLTVRIGVDHEVLIAASQLEIIAAALDAEPALAEARLRSPHIVCCPGRQFCSHGLADSRAFAIALRAHLTGRRDLPTMAVSGCPNGCTHPRIAAIGLTGGIAKDAAGESHDVFNLFADGDQGAGPALGVAAGSKLPATDAIAAIDDLLDKR